MHLVIVAARLVSTLVIFCPCPNRTCVFTLNAIYRLSEQQQAVRECTLQYKENTEPLCSPVLPYTLSLRGTTANNAQNMSPETRVDGP